MTHRNGMTLVSMLVMLVVALIVFALVSRVLLPSGSRTVTTPDGETTVTNTATGPIAQAQNVQCITNLNTIGQAMVMYQLGNNNRFPLLREVPASDAGVNAAPTSDTVTDAPYRETNWSELGDQGMQNVWLLIGTRHAPVTVFRCPGDRERQERTSEAKFGWASPYEYSYSIQWPYRSDASGATRNPAAFTATLDDMVILADRNPGGPVGPDRAPSNHPGTNTLWTNETVKYFGSDERSTVGVEGDEIYTNTAGVVGGIPQGPTDTSLTLTGRASDK
jgi:hypothetical protein